MVKNALASEGDSGSIPGLERFPEKRKWQPTPVFLLSYGQSSLAKIVRHKLATEQQLIN